MIVLGYIKPDETDIPLILAFYVKDMDIIYCTELSGCNEQIVYPEDFDEIKELNYFVEYNSKEPSQDCVLFLTPRSSTPEFKTIIYAETYMKTYCSLCRESGYLALRNNKTAQSWFDKARRVSNDPDDVIRLAYSLPVSDRKKWFDWLNRKYPDINPEKRARELLVHSDGFQ